MSSFSSFTLHRLRPPIAKWSPFDARRRADNSYSSSRLTFIKRKKDSIKCPTCRQIEMNFWIITVGEDNPGRLLIIGSHDENLNGLLHVLARACLIRGKGDVSPVETEGKRVGDSRIWPPDAFTKT